MYVLLTFFIAYLILNVLENYYRDLEKFTYAEKGTIKKVYQRLWKHYQFCQWVLVFAFMVILIFEPANLKAYLKYSHLLIIYSLFWTLLYDGGLNLLRGLSFFRTSTTTESWIEKNISLLAKIIALIISIITYWWLWL